MALNASQPCRPALLGVVIAFAILAFRRITDLTDAADRASIIGLFIRIWFSHITNTLCVCREACLTSTRPFLGLASSFQDDVEWPMP